MKVIINSVFGILFGGVAQAAPSIELAPEAETTFEPSVQLGGYASTELVVGGSSPTHFDAHHLVWFVGAEPHPRVSLSSEVEWEHGGTPVRVDRADEGGEVKVEQASVDLRLGRGLVARAGVLLAPLGAYNLQHEAPAHNLTERPLVDRYILPSTWSEAGAGVLWRGELKEVALEAQVYLVNGLDGLPVDGSGTRGQRGSLQEDVDDNKAVLGRLQAQQGSARLGVGAYQGTVDADRGLGLVLWEVDGRVGWRRLTVQGEVAGGGTPSGEASLLGGYVEVGLSVPLDRFTEESEWEGTSVELSLRAGAVDTDRSALTDGDRARVAGGLALRLSEQVVWKSELVTEGRGGSSLFARAWQPGAERRMVSSVAVLF